MAITARLNETRDATLTRRDFRGVLLAALGFAFLQSWMFVPLLGLPPVLPLDYAYSWMRAGSMLVLALIMSSNRMLSGRMGGAAPILFALLLSMGSTIRAFMGFSLIGQVLSGAGFAGLFLSWGMYLASIGPKRASISIAASGIATAILCSSTTIMHEQVALLFSSCLPVLSVAVLVFLGPEMQAAHVKPARAILGRKPSLPWKLALAIAIYSMVFEFTLRFTVQIAPTMFYLARDILFISYGLVALLLAVSEIRLAKGLNLSVAYCAALVPTFVALMLIPILDTQYLIVPRVIVTVSYVCFSLLVLIMYSNIASREGTNPIGVFGLGLFAEQTGSLLGSSFSLFESISFRQPLLGLSNLAIASVIAAMMLILATVSILSGQDAFIRRERPLPDDLDQIGHRCSISAQRYGLSKREHEILTLLARGRSNTYIKDALGVSMSTVNTHVKAIYHKIDVHSRQELLDLIERAEAGS